MSGNNINRIKSLPGTIGTVILVSVYLLLSVGILKATHFCMGREASVVFFSSDAKKCACSIYSGESDSCCDDEQELIKLENEQKVIPSFSLAVPEWFALEELYTEQFVALETGLSDAFSFNDPPPPKIPLFKVHCSFVFYDDRALIG